MTEPRPTSRPRRILAVASGGGHWVQLLRLRPAFEGAEVAYVTVSDSYRTEVPGARFYTVKDATRWNKLALVQMALKLAVIVARERPDVVVSTGAAPGYFAIRLARVLGARAVWLDSIANVEQLSMAGEKAGNHLRDDRGLWLTQWEHLSREDGPRFEGAVL